MKDLLRSVGKYVFFSLCFGVLSVGCVTTSQYQELVESYDTLNNEKVAADQSCKEDIEQLTKQLTELDQKTLDLQRQNEELATQYAELNEKDAVLQEKSAKAEEMRVMIDRLQQDLNGQQAIVRQLEDTLRIEVVEKLMFESGSDRVTAKGSGILARIAPTLASAGDKEILIVGHTDDLPPSKTLAKKFPSNWELSAARAAAIVHILTWKYNIDPARMIIQGAAHYHPLTMYDAKNKNYRKTNRVVEIILKPKTS